MIFINCPDCGLKHQPGVCGGSNSKHIAPAVQVSLHSALRKSVKVVAKGRKAESKPKPPAVCPTCGQVSYNEAMRIKMREWRAKKKAEKAQT